MGKTFDVKLWSFKKMENIENKRGRNEWAIIKDIKMVKCVKYRREESKVRRMLECFFVSFQIQGIKKAKTNLIIHYQYTHTTLTTILF